MPADPGYSLHPGILSTTQCDRLTIRLSDDSLPRTRAGARHLMSHPSVRALAADPCLTRIAAAALDREAVPFRATLFDKSPATNWLIPWHQDTALPLKAQFDSPHWGPWSCKAGVTYAHAPAWALERVVALRIHLDDSGPCNGPLRVIPWTHNTGVLTDDQVAATVCSRRAVECLAPRGGVIVMRPLIIHSSSKVLTDTPRRVIHIEYADALELAPGVHLAIA